MLPFIPPQMPQSTVRPYHSTGSSPKKKESKTSTLRDKNENGRTPLAPAVQTPPYVDIAGTLSEAAILPVVDESPGTPLASTAETPPYVDIAGTLSEAANLPVVDESPSTPLASAAETPLDVDIAGTLSEAANLPVVDESPGTHSAPNDEPVKHIVDPNEIHAGTPRSGGGVVERFATHRYYDENGKSDFGLQLLWQAKHNKFVKHGYTSLIGEVATYIDRHFTKFFSDYELRTGIVLTKKFKKLGDIQTYDGSYEKIICLMFKNNECTLATAKDLLESLSLPQMNGKIEPKDEPSDLPLSHGQALFSKLFDEKRNPKNAQKLMGALICEAIRFQEDGALARMAMREIIRLFQTPLKSDKIEDNPFYQVFVAGVNPVVFAMVGGKQKTLELFFKIHTWQDFSPLSAYIDETSDVDELSDVNKDSSQTTTAPASPRTPESNKRHRKPTSRFTPDLHGKPKSKPKGKRTFEQKDQEKTESLHFGQRNLEKEFSAEENKDGKTTGQGE